MYWITLDQGLMNPRGMDEIMELLLSMHGVATAQTDCGSINKMILPHIQHHACFLFALARLLTSGSLFFYFDCSSCVVNRERAVSLHVHALCGLWGPLTYQWVPAHATQG